MLPIPVTHELRLSVAGLPGHSLLHLRSYYVALGTGEYLWT